MKTLSLSEGTLVRYNNKKYCIYRHLNLNWVMGQEEGTNRIEKLKISEIQPLETELDQNVVEPPIDLSSEKDWQIATERFNAIKPLIANKGNGALVKEISTKSGHSVASLYRWLDSYDTTGLLSSLIPKDNNGGRGLSRLSPELDEIIKSVIEDVYLSKQRKSLSHVCKEVMIRCKNANVTAPHSNTIRYRLAQISEFQRIAGRFGKKMAKEQFSPKTGSFPDLDHPLSVIQIDHTKLDIIVVDETYRRPIGRPWITLAIDVYSRMVCGFYISLDPPGAIGTGLCISHCILPKEQWLAKLDVQGEWPCWGVMQVIHLDNAREFKGNMLRRASEEYNIQLEWRPVATPHYGGHIERLLGTFMRELHSLPGTTFSNTKQRRGYNSEKEAVFTLKELEVWLTTFVVNVYHKKIHSSINTTPFAKFSAGIFGDNNSPGIGIPPRILNERKLRLDFMPFVERTVQDYGVVIDGIYYYHDVLRGYINASEPNGGKNRTKTKFIFKRDLRDISTIYFLDPENKEYYAIPYRNTSRPSMSIWEFNEVIQKLKDQGKQDYNEDMIFEAYEVMRNIENMAIQKTKGNKRMNGKYLKRAEARANIEKTNALTIKKSIEFEFVPPSGNIEAYDDLDF